MHMYNLNILYIYSVYLYYVLSFPVYPTITIYYAHLHEVTE